MNYYGPRLREDGRWYYECQNGGCHVIGYCGPCEGDLPNANKHHTHGHATRAEACECYREYLLDHLDFSLVLKQRMWTRACEGCLEQTDELVQVDHRPMALCAKCRTRDVVARLLHVDVAAVPF